MLPPNSSARTQSSFYIAFITEFFRRRALVLYDHFVQVIPDILVPLQA